MNTFFLVCFVLGLVLSVLAAFAGGGRLHLHMHAGHAHGVHARGHGVSAVNGFTVTAFLCWFGGVGYLLHNSTAMMTWLILLIAIASGWGGAAVLYAVLFKLLLPRERVLDAEDTRMEGVVGQVSDAVRDGGGIGEILFTQLGVRRSAPARSEGGVGIARGAEVVVIGWERGVATVRVLGELGMVEDEQRQGQKQIRAG